MHSNHRVALGVALTALVTAVIACGGGTSQEAAPTESAPIANPVDPATAGEVTGRVTFEGTAPKPAALRMDSDPNCVQPGNNPINESLVVGENGAVQNVFVYVKDGLGDLRFPVPPAAVVLDQKGCHYVPHVLGVQVGQPLEVLNSDPTLHNVHALPKANREFNTGQPIPGMKHTHRFSTREVMVFFKCDVHPWMRAHVGVLDHPYFGVTGSDGTFNLKGLPPGSYTVEAWHETLGTQTQMVTIGPKESADIAFSFKSTT
jgi:plastocyanin